MCARECVYTGLNLVLFEEKFHFIAKLSSHLVFLTALPLLGVTGRAHDGQNQGSPLDESPAHHRAL